MSSSALWHCGSFRREGALGLVSDGWAGTCKAEKMGIACQEQEQHMTSRVLKHGVGEGTCRAISQGSREIRKVFMPTVLEAGVGKNERESLQPKRQGENH